MYIAGHRGMVGSAPAADNCDLAASHVLPVPADIPAIFAFLARR